MKTHVNINNNCEIVLTYCWFKRKEKISQLWQKVWVFMFLLNNNFVCRHRFKLAVVSFRNVKTSKESIESWIWLLLPSEDSSIGINNHCLLTSFNYSELNGVDFWDHICVRRPHRCPSIAIVPLQSVKYFL